MRSVHRAGTDGLDATVTDPFGQVQFRQTNNRANCIVCGEHHVDGEGQWHVYDSSTGELTKTRAVY